MAMAVCCFITAAATADVLTGSMRSGPERSFDPALSDHRRRAKRKRLTTRNDGTPVSGQGCSVVHDLRHTFATLALSAGEHYMQVSKWLGHSTFTLTLDVYGDYISSAYISSAEGGKAAPLARPVAASAITNVVPIDRGAQ